MSDVKNMIAEVLNNSYIQREANRRINGDKSITFLEEYLHPDEQPEMVIEASTSISVGFETKTSRGFLLTTDRRVVFAGQLGGFLESKKPIYKEFSCASIALVRYSKGGGIVFHINTTAANGNVAEVVFGSASRSEDIQKYITHLQQKLATLQTGSGGQTSSQSDDLLAQLERLGRLKKEGLLTDEEFAAAKKKLLNN